MKNCVIWTRVSTKYQEDNGGSLSDQKNKCELFARQNGYDIKGYFGGTHESAKTPGALVKAMFDVVYKDKSIKYILVSVADRFSRNEAQASMIINELLKRGKVIVEATTGIDTSTREGMLMIKMKLALAEWDNGNRTDKFVSGRKHCPESGVYCGAAKPLGYDKHGKSLGTYFTVNDKGHLIRKAFKWKLQGYANCEILKKLSAYGLTMRKQKLQLAHISGNLLMHCLQMVEILVILAIQVIPVLAPIAKSQCLQMLSYSMLLQIKVTHVYMTMQKRHREPNLQLLKTV